MNVKGFVMKKNILVGLTILLTTVLCSNRTNAQYCDSITPSFTVDLSASPYMTWLSPNTDRDGFCCGASSPDKCLEFIITLNPNSAAIIFNVASGAVPPGALFYQVDCGPPTPVGSPICLQGVGPFHLTFCKPGNNTNTYSIETVPNPIFGPNISLGDGCSGLLGVQFYDESTVTWTSISPGASETYNNLLSCSSGCDTASVTNIGGLPAQVNYLVCGTALNGCTFGPVCDTISVSFAQELSVSIIAPDTVLCANETTVPASVSITGGTPPYSISWSNGGSGTTNNIGVGNTTVNITDASGCTAVMDQVTVTQLPPLTIDAGNDIVQCSNYIGAITLNGTTNASGVIWSGQGTFLPSNMVIDPDYVPSYEEITSGNAYVTVTTNDISGCPNVTDGMNIAFNEVYQSVSITTTDVTCNGLNNGSVTVTATGPQAPFTYSFDNGAYSSANTASGLTPGTHTVAIQSSLGCDSLITFSIFEPSALNVVQTSAGNVSCNGGNNGFVTSGISGGTPNYTYSWNTNPVQNTPNANNLTAGNYTLTITDANGCNIQLMSNITEPTPLMLNFNTVEPSCFGLANGAISSNVNGGTSPYTYLWNSGSTATSIYSVSAGNYSVTVTDNNGCVISAVENVGQPPQLLLTANNDTIVCPGLPQTITANASGGTGTYAYSWTPISGNQSTIIVSPITNTTYTCTVQDNNGCTANSTTTITVFGLDPNDVQAMASPDSICLHADVNLFGQYNGNDPTVVLSWDFCPTCPAQTTDTPSQTTTYTITATNQCNQTIDADVTVVVVMPPAIDLDPSQPAVCQYEEFTIESSTFVNPTYTYYWDFNGVLLVGDEVEFSFDEPGTYNISVYAINSFGCTSDSTATSTITVNPQANASFNPSAYIETTLDPSFTFNNTSTEANTYLWDFGDGAVSTSINTSHTYADYGSYTVTLTANNTFNCPDETSIVVEVKPEFGIFIPNAFTPDGDANNGIFFAQGFGILDEGFEFQIFNRWGELIYYSEDLSAGWDGNYRTAEPAQDGVYVWTVKFKDLTGKRHEQNGHVSLLR